MLTRPADVLDDDIISALRTGWQLGVDSVAYAPVGFGSHHWLASSEERRWFVSVDDLDARLTSADDTREAAGRRLAVALTGARALRDAGLDFVVAPHPTTRVAATHRLDVANGRFAMSVYPFLDGTTHAWGAFVSPHERRAVIDLLVKLHQVEGEILGTLAVDDFTIPRRAELESRLTGSRWGLGPFADRARALVGARAAIVHSRLARYDELVALVLSANERFVATHGEPHRGNTIATSTGIVLVDWDTLLLAPPERDLVVAAGGDEQLTAEYAMRMNRRPNAEACELYGERWALTEIALFTHELAEAHLDTEDNRVALRELERYLSPPGPA